MSTNEFPADQPVPPDVGFSITCRPERITRSLRTVQAVSAAGTPATDRGGRIGVRPDGTAEGCIVLRPVVTWTRKGAARVGS